MTGEFVVRALIVPVLMPLLLLAPLATVQADPGGPDQAVRPAEPSARGSGLRIEVPQAPQPDAQQNSNLQRTLKLLDEPDLDSGAVPYLRLSSPSGMDYDVWPGPMIDGQQGQRCRILYVGDMTTTRVEQSMAACRTDQRPWTIARTLEDLPEEDRDLLVKAFGRAPAIGVGSDPYKAP